MTRTKKSRSLMHRRTAVLEVLDALTAARLDLDDAVFFLKLLSDPENERVWTGRVVMLARLALGKATAAIATLKETQRQIDRCR